MTVIRCDTPNALLRELEAIQYAGKSGDWLFRGQGDSSWTLVPSLFRTQDFGRCLTDTEAREFEHQMLTALQGDLVNRTDTPSRFLLPTAVVAGYGKLRSDWTVEKPDGSIVGYDAADREMPLAHLGPEDMAHFPRRIQLAWSFLMGLAQHYGCPTRTLDFSYSPLVAAYFAASDSVRRPGSDSCAVFAIPTLIQHAQHLHGSWHCTPPSAANKHIEAQAGALFVLDWQCKDLWLPRFQKPGPQPSTVIESGRATPKVDSKFDSRFVKYELPQKHAGALLRMLRGRGVDAVNLFPGPHGLVAAGRDQAWQNLFP